MYYLVVSFNLLKSQQIRITFILQEEKQLLREGKITQSCIASRLQLPFEEGSVLLQSPWCFCHYAIARLKQLQIPPNHISTGHCIWFFLECDCDWKMMKLVYIHLFSLALCQETVTWKSCLHHRRSSKLMCGDLGHSFEPTAQKVP